MWNVPTSATADNWSHDLSYTPGTAGTVLAARHLGCLFSDTWHVDASTQQGLVASPFRCGIVLRVLEDACEIFGDGQARSVGYAKQFPSPRTERVSPGHLVAVATAPDGSPVVVWRWYDAVVLGEESGLTRLWEPLHGEVVAQRRRAQQRRPIGTRAYLSAGLPGADWWVAGGVADRAEDADVELADVERIYHEHDLWKDLV
jgi:hypothetical protein